MPLWPYHPFGTSSRWGSQIFFIEVKTVYSRRLNSCKTYAIWVKKVKHNFEPPIFGTS